MPAAEPCTPTPPVRFDGSPVPDPATLRFNSNDGVRLRVCGPGILTLRAEGTAVDGVGARLLVALDAATLWDATVDGTEDVRVALPRAGWVVVAFANDRYAPPQDRNLVVRDLVVRDLTADNPVSPAASGSPGSAPASGAP